jgi:hypothetical protein
MTKPLLLASLVFAVCSASGCSFFRKGDRPKENSAIASENEEMFRRRWVDKRAGELAATGVAADAARAQADAEFSERYGFAPKPRK